MDFLSDQYLPGAVTLVCALFFALASLYGYIEVMIGDKKALDALRILTLVEGVYPLSQFLLKFGKDAIVFWIFR